MRFKPASVIVIAIFFLLGLSVYSAPLQIGFLSDDYELLECATGHSLRAWFGAFIRPLVFLTFYLDWLIWGTNPFGFHLLNVFVHILNAILVVQILACLMTLICLEEPKRFVPAMAGLIFLILPCHAEAVSWISGRTDVIATFFACASILCYLMAYRAKEQKFVSLSLAFFTFGLFSKESCIVIPLLVTVINLGIAFCNKDFCKDKCHLNLLPLSTVAYFFIILIIYFGVRRLVFGEFIGGYGFNRHVPLAPFDVMLSIYYTGVKLTKMFVPLNLIVGLDVAPVPWHRILLRILVGLLGGIAGALSLGAVLAYGIAGLRSQRNGSVERLLRAFSNRSHVLIIVFCCTMVCFVSTLNLGIALDNTESDRHVYLPSVFGAMMLAVIMAALLRRMKKAWIVLTVIICGYIGALYNVSAAVGQK